MFALPFELDHDGTPHSFRSVLRVMDVRPRPEFTVKTAREQPMLRHLNDVFRLLVIARHDVTPIQKSSYETVWSIDCNRCAD